LILPCCNRGVVHKRTKASGFHRFYLSVCDEKVITTKNNNLFLEMEKAKKQKA